MLRTLVKRFSLYLADRYVSLSRTAITGIIRPSWQTKSQAYSHQKYDSISLRRLWVESLESRVLLAHLEFSVPVMTGGVTLTYTNYNSMGVEQTTNGTYEVNEAAGDYVTYGYLTHATAGILFRQDPQRISATASAHILQKFSVTVVADEGGEEYPGQLMFLNIELVTAQLGVSGGKSTATFDGNGETRSQITRIGQSFQVVLEASANLSVGAGDDHTSVGCSGGADVSITVRRLFLNSSLEFDRKSGDAILSFSTNAPPDTRGLSTISIPVNFTYGTGDSALPALTGKIINLGQSKLVVPSDSFKPLDIQLFSSLHLDSNLVASIDPDHAQLVAGPVVSFANFTGTGIKQTVESRGFPGGSNEAIQAEKNKVYTIYAVFHNGYWVPVKMEYRWQENVYFIDSISGSKGAFGGPLTITLLSQITSPDKTTDTLLGAFVHSWKWLQIPGDALDINKYQTSLWQKQLQEIMQTIGEKTASAAEAWSMFNNVLEASDLISLVLNSVPSNTTTIWLYSPAGTVQRPITIEVPSYYQNKLQGYVALQAMAAASLDIAYLSASTGFIPGALMAALSYTYLLKGSLNALDGAMDPPDFNYRKIETVPEPSLPPDLAELPEGLERELALLIVNLNNLSNAEYVSKNRADGAAIAGDYLWQSRQLQAAAQFSAVQATLSPLLQQLMTQEQLQIQHAAASFSVDAIVESARVNGAPAALVSRLSEMGWKKNEIENLTTAFIENYPVSGNDYSDLATSLTMDGVPHATDTAEYLAAVIAVQTGSLGQVGRELTPAEVDDLNAREAAIAIGLSNGKPINGLDGQISQLMDLVQKLLIATNNQQVLSPYSAFARNSLFRLQYLKSEAWVLGSVYVDKNLNGVLDGTEPGLADASIFIDEDGNGLWNPPVEKTTSSFSNSILVDQTSLTGSVSKVSVTINVDVPGGFDRDVSANLVSPSGLRVRLFSNVGRAGETFTETTLSDDAISELRDSVTPFTGTFHPEEPLSWLIGEKASGQWTLDLAGSQSIVLNSWSLKIATIGESVALSNTSGNYSLGVAAIGDQMLRVFSSPYIPTSPIGGGTYLSILRGEESRQNFGMTVPTLFVTLDQISVSENGGKVIGTVRRNTPTTQSMTVLLTSDDTTEAIVPASIIILAGETVATFEAMGIADGVVDGDQTLVISANASGFASGSVPLTVIDEDHWSWSNPINALDVDDDGGVNPLDVLVLVNDINNFGSRRLDSLTSKPKAYLDVDHDNSLSPLDVLVLLNYLNARNGNRAIGEGEASPNSIPDQFLFEPGSSSKGKSAQFDNIDTVFSTESWTSEMDQRPFKVRRTLK